MTGLVMKLPWRISCTEKYSRMEHTSKQWKSPLSKTNIRPQRNRGNVGRAQRKMKGLRCATQHYDNTLPTIGLKEGTSSHPYVKMVQISSRDYLDQLNE